MATKISFIGAGRVGTALARLLVERGSQAELEVVGIASRTPASARRAAAFAGVPALASAVEAAAAADLVFVTTQDVQVGPVWEGLAQAAGRGELDLAGKLVCHCSGALSSEVFAGAANLGCQVASAHPLYAVSSPEVWRELTGAWFCVEGDQGACDLLVPALGRMGLHVETIPPSLKVRYHAAAVMASNLVVGLYARAAAELELCGFSPEAAGQALAPLFLGNAQHVAREGAEAALTGPAKRGDMATIQAHLDTLEGDDRQVYLLLTKELLELSGRGRD